jgi:hypothetical protein
MQACICPFLALREALCHGNRFLILSWQQIPVDFALSGAVGYALWDEWVQMIRAVIHHSVSVF